MSSEQLIGSNGVLQDVYYPAEDLSNYVGCAVYNTTGNLAGPLSVTNQAGTQQVFGLGVLRNSGRFESGGIGRQVEIIENDVVWAKAGTGGVAAGDTVVPEYAASGTDRGRFISVATADLTDEDFTWGTAMTAAAEDGLFKLDLRRSKAFLDGGA